MDFKYKNVFKYQGKTIGGTPYYNEKNEKPATKRKRRRGRECDTSRREKGNKSKREVGENVADPTASVEVVEAPASRENDDDVKDSIETADGNEENKVGISKTFADVSVSTVSSDGMHVVVQ